MIVVLKAGKSQQDFDNLFAWIEAQGVQASRIDGDLSSVVALVGDTSRLDIGKLRSFAAVENVVRVQEPFKLASRKFHPTNTVVNVGGARFGGNAFQLIAGPCAVESEKQMIDIAVALKKAGATALRGGVFKPRTSPYSFQGLGVEGLKLLRKAKEETGLPIVTELPDPAYIDDFYGVDVIQVGARNMQNFELLKRLGKLKTPVLLKRGMCATIEEWLLSAEYILSEGNPNVILCERGIRTFDAYMRATLDLTAIPALKERTHLPIIVDPSHAAGAAKYVKPLCLSSAGAGADGVIVEVHDRPQDALCDGAQALTPAQFEDVVKAIDGILPAVGKAREL